jgi:two-component system response regulator RegX3
MSTSAQSVLVVDDDEIFVDTLRTGLIREGYGVHVARNGLDALRLFETEKPDLVLLDVMLPRLSGIEVCLAIRKMSRTPIIMLSALGGEIDIVVGLEVGADDYVVKPYRWRELLARMTAVQRRLDRRVADTQSYASIQIGAVCMDPGSHELRVDGRRVGVPLKEFEVLRLLMENAGRVVTRERLIHGVWGRDYGGDGKTLNVHIKRVRSRVEPHRFRPERITTIRGVGYRYESRS